jgi:CheY-like chemotaxis protein
LRVSRLPRSKSIEPSIQTATTLLIADNDNRARNTLQRRLKAGGYTVLTTDTSQQAIRLVDAKHPHLLLLGDHLNDAEGLWLCEQIKSDASLGFLPIIHMTGQANGPWEDDTDLSPDATLHKPINGGAWPGLRCFLRIKRQVSILPPRAMHAQEESAQNRHHRQCSARTRYAWCRSLRSLLNEV